MQSVLDIAVVANKPLSQVRMVIFDVDNTLVQAKDANFYSQYSQMVERAVSTYYGVTLAESKKIADYYRQQHGGGEQALFLGNAHTHFSTLQPLPPDFETLYKLLITINPENAFTNQSVLRKLILELKSCGVLIVALTSSPDTLSKKILTESGYNPSNDFTHFISYTSEQGPPKLLNAVDVFSGIAKKFNILTSQTLAIGDSLEYDVLPAISAGMLACHISNTQTPGYTGLIASETVHIIKALLHLKKGV